MENLVRLVEQGNIDAMVDLGEKCINGEDGFDFYETTVANWFDIAARQGHAKGQYYLGLCYEDGFGVVQNYFYAYLYYKKAAEQGYSDAMTNLGLCYYLGHGTPKNYKEAMNWWEKAANLGNAMALYNLGGRYLAGEIVEKNSSKAKELFRQASELGCEMASKALAKMNEKDEKHIDFESNNSYSSLKENAYLTASERGFFHGNARTYNMSLNYSKRYITEQIIRKTWDYHENNNSNITDGQETRLIMQNCIYAGMFAAKFPDMDANILLESISKPNITRIQKYVENYFSFNGEETFVANLVAKGLVQDIYHNNMHLYSNCSTPTKHWEYYKDFACAMFELGAIYYENRK